MGETTFSLKGDAHAVKVHYDNSDNISVIKVYPEHHSDIKIVLGSRSVTISDEKRKQRSAQKQPKKDGGNVQDMHNPFPFPSESVDTDH